MQYVSFQLLRTSEKSQDVRNDEVIRNVIFPNIVPEVSGIYLIPYLTLVCIDEKQSCGNIRRID